MEKCKGKWLVCRRRSGRMRQSWCEDRGSATIQYGLDFVLFFLLLSISFSIFHCESPRQLRSNCILEPDVLCVMTWFLYLPISYSIDLSFWLLSTQLFLASDEPTAKTIVSLSPFHSSFLSMYIWYTLWVTVLSFFVTRFNLTVTADWAIVFGIES